MKSLIREVILPASAAVGFLVTMTMPPVKAQEATTVPEPVAALAATAPAAAPATQDAGANRAVAGKASVPRIERRCELVERIGKFAIRRCE